MFLDRPLQEQIDELEKRMQDEKYEAQCLEDRAQQCRINAAQCADRILRLQQRKAREERHDGR